MNQICEVTIDQAGNIKLPDELLAASGLRPGSKMIVQRNAHGEFRLRPQEPSIAASSEEIAIELVEENGHLFLRGVKPFDIDRLMEEEREARMSELMEGIKF